MFDGPLGAGVTILGMFRFFGYVLRSMSGDRNLGLSCSVNVAHTRIRNVSALHAFSILHEPHIREPFLRMTP
jgi:hypothetical protein